MLKRAGLIIVCIAALGVGAVCDAFPSDAANAVLEAHAKAFLKIEDNRAWFKETTAGGKTSFWMAAEQMEMELDAYDRTHDPRQLAVFAALFNGFIASHGADWRKNDFNDDIMWMVIACARGYLLTGKTVFLDAARSNFDVCFARAWSLDLGGGLWWKTDNLSKNACVNGPGAIAAALLDRACKEPSYRKKAVDIFLWERASLFDPETGRVFDNIRRGGHASRMSFSYNQGTFVGAANLLGYTNEAMKAATFTMNRLCGDDGLLPVYGETGDSGGFNGICARWIARFMKDRGAQPVFESWLQKNADAAWTVRRADNLSWNNWRKATPDGLRYSWGCSSSVVILQVVQPAESPK